MECTVTCMVLNFEWCFKLLLSSLMQMYVFYKDFWCTVVFIDYLYFYYLCSVLSYVEKWNEMTHAAQIPRVQFKQGITKELFWKVFFILFSEFTEFVMLYLMGRCSDYSNMLRQSVNFYDMLQRDTGLF